MGVSREGRAASLVPELSARTARSRGGSWARTERGRLGREKSRRNLRLSRGSSVLSGVFVRSGAEASRSGLGHSRLPKTRSTRSTPGTTEDVKHFKYLERAPANSLAGSLPPATTSVQVASKVILAAGGGLRPFVLRQDVIDQAVLFGLFAVHVEIAIRIAGDHLEIFPSVLGEEAIEPVAVS